MLKIIYFWLTQIFPFLLKTHKKEFFETEKKFGEDISVKKVFLLQIEGSIWRRKHFGNNFFLEMGVMLLAEKSESLRNHVLDYLRGLLHVLMLLLICEVLYFYNNFVLFLILGKAKLHCNGWLFTWHLHIDLIKIDCVVI